MRLGAPPRAQVVAAVDVQQPQRARLAAVHVVVRVALRLAAAGVSSRRRPRRAACAGRARERSRRRVVLEALARVERVVVIVLERGLAERVAHAEDREVLLHGRDARARLGASAGRHGAGVAAPGVVPPGVAAAGAAVPPPASAAPLAAPAVVGGAAARGRVDCDVDAPRHLDRTAQNDVHAVDRVALLEDDAAARVLAQRRRGEQRAHVALVPLGELCAEELEARHHAQQQR